MSVSTFKPQIGKYVKFVVNIQIFFDVKLLYRRFGKKYYLSRSFVTVGHNDTHTHMA